MAKPKKYPVRTMIATSAETDQQLRETAAIMGVQKAVAGRIILETQLKNLATTDPEAIRKVAQKSQGKSKP